VEEAIVRVVAGDRAALQAVVLKEVGAQSLHPLGEGGTAGEAGGEPDGEAIEADAEGGGGVVRVGDGGEQGTAALQVHLRLRQGGKRLQVAIHLQGVDAANHPVDPRQGRHAPTCRPRRLQGREGRTTHRQQPLAYRLVNRRVRIPEEGNQGRDPLRGDVPIHTMCLDPLPRSPAARRSCRPTLALCSAPTRAPLHRPTPTAEG